MPKKVLLYGPNMGKFKKAYGGGVGGYTRKMGLYLNHFHSEKYRICPSYHTVRGQFLVEFLLFRFVLDYFVFLKDLIRYRPNIIHVLAQYRGASPREFAIAFTARLMNIPLVYEIKAGVFIPWYQNANPWYKQMVRYCINTARVVLCQGKPYVDFLENKLNKNAHFYPNFVPTTDIPKQINTKLQTESLRILFVGYAFRDKGVFELVEACLDVAGQVPIELTFVGKLHPEFAEWLEQRSIPEKLTIVKRGLLAPEEVMNEFSRHDIYCYPTRHKGEGHNNSINEAMMHGLVIITTRQGFLGSILDPGICYFLDTVDEKEIATTLRNIDQHRETARQKAKGAHQHLLDNYTSTVAFQKLEALYDII